MPVFTRELRVQEGIDDLAGQGRANHARADAQHVHGVVLHCLMCGVGVVADGGADARKLVRGDRDPGAAPADDDAAIGMAIEYRLRNRFG